jgi:hypothetical protein
MIADMKLWILFCTSVSLTWFATAQTATTDLDQVVATVNGQPVLERDWRQEALIHGFLAGHRGICPDFQELPNLQFQMARVVVGASQVQGLAYEAALKDIEIDENSSNAFFQGFQDGFDLFFGTKTFADYVQCTSDTEEMIENRGLYFLKFLEKSQRVYQSAPITNTEVEQYFAAHQSNYAFPPRIVARMIVVPNRKLAAEVYGAAQKGMDFAVLARKYSILGGAKDGALGASVGSQQPKPLTEYDLENLPTKLVQEAFGLVHGGLTHVFTAGEWHYIIKVNQYLAPKTRTLNEVKTRVEADVFNAKGKGLFEIWQKSVLEQAQIRFTEENFDPVVARVNGQEIPFSALQFVFEVFSPDFNQEVIPQRLNDLIKAFVQSQGLVNQGFEAIGSEGDRLSAFFDSQENKIVVSEAEMKSFYQTQIEDYQKPASAETLHYLFKNKNLAEVFRKEALAFGDKPKKSNAQAILEMDSSIPTSFKNATKSPKNAEMFVSPTYNNSKTQWAVDLIFFPVAARTIPFESVRDSIFQYLKDIKSHVFAERWTATQLANAKIENLLEDAIKILEQRSTRW